MPECPRCGANLSIDIDDDFTTIECWHCSARLEIEVIVNVDLIEDDEPEEEESEPVEYDPGPEVDDEGGMSEFRHGDL
jgi:hypothetical protein